MSALDDTRKISTHTPLAGRGATAPPTTNPYRVFQLTRPLRGVATAKAVIMGGSFISTHTPLAGRGEAQDRFCIIGGISTHTPLAGRGDENQALRLAASQISTHTPLAGRGTAGFVPVDVDDDFNSHAPCGAWPIIVDLKTTADAFQLTRPLRGVACTQGK